MIQMRHTIVGTLIAQSTVLEIILSILVLVMGLIFYGPRFMKVPIQLVPFPPTFQRIDALR